MISIEKRRNIFLRYFHDFHSIREISRDLSISRSTVGKIIKEYRLKIVELGLIEEPDLEHFIELIVTQPKRKKRNVKRYKVTEKHIEIIEKLVIDNERKRTRMGKQKTKIQNSLQLYSEFCCETDCSSRYGDPFTYGTFCSIVREIKKKLKLGLI